MLKCARVSGYRVIGAQMTLTSLMGWTEMRSAVYSAQGWVQQMSIFHGDLVLTSAETYGFESFERGPMLPIKLCCEQRGAQGVAGEAELYQLSKTGQVKGSAVGRM